MSEYDESLMLKDYTAFGSGTISMRSYVVSRNVTVGGVLDTLWDTAKIVSVTVKWLHVMSIESSDKAVVIA